jgi:hypothetical protein
MYLSIAVVQGVSRRCTRRGQRPGLPDHLVRLEEEGQGDRQVEDLGGPLTPHRRPTGHRGVPVMRKRHDDWAISPPRPPVRLRRHSPLHRLVY